MTLEVTTPRDGIALVTFNRPESLNAMSEQFVEDLLAALASLGTDPAVRVVVLTGAGRGFSSGHELGELTDVGEGVDIQRAMANQRLYSSLTIAINELPKPVIAAVNGPAAGGGLAMALAADTRLCSPTARFNAAFVRLGISGCDVGVSYLLPRIVGPTLAFEMMLSGRLIDADEAVSSGLVLRVSEDVVTDALDLADTFIANAPFAVELTKRAMWGALAAPSLRHAIELEDRTQVLCIQTGDILKAAPAVLAKTRVDWSA